MSAVSISAERAEIVDNVCRKLVAGFLKPIGSSNADGQISKEAFLAVYQPDIRWYDHAFLICRQGHEAVIGLQVAFTHCNQPFKVDIKVRSATFPWVKDKTDRPRPSHRPRRALFSSRSGLAGVVTTSCGRMGRLQ